MPGTTRHAICNLQSAICILRSTCPALLAAILALALYSRTLAPGLTWAHDGADGGDLLTAALTRGVPHPTGYPTYQLLLTAALALVPGEPARVGNAFSAFCAASAVGFLADLSRRRLAGRPWRGLAALTVGLVWAASPGLWSQAVITEVYALNALVMVALLWLLERWREAAQGAGWPWLSAAGLLFGLGLGNHLTLLLLLPGLLLWLWPARHALWYGGTAITRMLPLVGVALGLAVYGYLPWAAAGAPPINWGDPQTPAGLWWSVSGNIYRALVFGVPPAHLPGRLAAWGAEAGRQLGGGPWGALIALAGVWRLGRIDHAWQRGTVVIVLVYSVYAIGYNTADSYVYLIPAWAVASLWLGEGVVWIAEWSAPRLGSRGAVAGVIGLALALSLSAVVRPWAQMDLSRDYAAQEFVTGALSTAAPGALILTSGDATTFALWYARYGLGQRPDLTPINVHLYGQPWYQAGLLRYHPALTAQAEGGKLPPLEALMLTTAETGVLYRADGLGEGLPALHEAPAGVLVRLLVP